MAEVSDFIDRSLAQYEVQHGGKKGNVTLISFDGRYKVVRQIQESLVFDERLMAAKALIDECIQVWSKGSNAHIKLLVNDAFQVDQAGKINTGRVLGLRRAKIDDEKWQRAMAAIGDIFREVEAGSCDYGVVPVENSTEGVISHTLDLFMSYSLMIAGEVSLRIHHHLMSQGGSLGDIKVLYSHQQSLAQCRSWLDRHLPHAERVAVGSNAEAARLAASEVGTAAVAGLPAAEIYGLKVLAERIEDDPGNTTRFLVIGAKDSPPSGQDKTSLLLSCRNESGGLHGLLSPLAEHGISMTRIESRPSRRGIWDYVFFIDILGHRSDPKVAGALEHLKNASILFKVLGSYPVAVL